MRIILMISMTLALFACGAAEKVDKNGEKVTLYRSYEEAPLAGSKRRRTFVCHEGRETTGFISSHVSKCINRIRNKAGKVGAKYVVIDRDRHVWKGLGCLNCVRVKGEAFF